MMALSKVMFQSKRQDWRTPSTLYAELDQEFHFDCDPCPTKGDFIHERDGLGSDWGDVSYVNPPYNKSAQWIKKAYEQWQKGKTIVLLLPARTDTNAFHDYIYGRAEIRFLRGRLQFDDLKDPAKRAPFPSMIVVFKGIKTQLGGLTDG